MKNIMLVFISTIIFLSIADKATADTYYSVFGTVTGNIEYDDKIMCNSKYPLHIEFSNKSIRTVSSIHFTPVATFQGRSTNLVSERTILLVGWSWDRIIGKFGTIGACYRLPELRVEDNVSPKDLVWEIEIKDVYWK
jgi:hypothetical protein